jgi:hypothetical protein
MNIFFLSTNPNKAARYHCDKHVIKMLLETCQLLYTCHWIVAAIHNTKPDFSTAPLAKSSNSQGYKSSHKNHPCGKWVRMSRSHYHWLSVLGLELLREYDYRFGQSSGKTHGCAEHIKWLYYNQPPQLKDYGFVDPLQAMPPTYYHRDSVIAYRRYYNGAKQHILKYTKRHPPHWLQITQTATT